MNILSHIFPGKKQPRVKIIIFIGLAIMMTTNAIGAPTSFKLRSPEFYFGDAKTLALLTAALAGDLSKAKWLVEEGANPNDEGPLTNKYNRLRPLHFAIAANNRQAVQVLVDVGADPELSVQGFGRAFLFAMTLNNHEMLSLLLNIRPISTLSQETLEYLLFESDQCPKCLEIVLNHGMPIDLRDGAGYTILMRVMDGQDYDLAEWLLAKGASVNVEAGGGVTPAYSAEFHLRKWKPGSPKYNKVLRLKKLMEERGAVFPAATPEQVRAKRAAR